MTPLRAAVRGLTRSFSAPGLLLALWLANLLFVLPAAWVMAGSLEQDIGTSLAHESLRTGFDMDWYSEFRDRSAGLASTFTPSKVVGMGPFLDNLEAWVSGTWTRGQRAILAIVFAHGLLWTLFLGGIVERFSDRGGVATADRFFGACGRFFFRFLRLALVSAPLYYLIYRLGRWSLQRIADGARDGSRETPVLIAVVLATLGVAVLLHLVRMIFDYGKIIMVLEERRSALAAAVSGGLFVLRHPLRTVGVDLIFVILGVGSFAIYRLIVPGTEQGTVFQILLALALGQLFILGRLVLRLGLISAELETYRYHQRR